MSALDGWIDICRAGTWRDMQGHDVCLDEERLDRIVEMHAAADPAPIVIGHPEADAPAYAWIEGLRRVGDRLQAKLRDIAPSFREAVEAGRFSGRSIALQGDALRHVGFLGGRAPAVPGLVPTRFAAAPETVVAFIDDNEAEPPDDSRTDRPDSLLPLGPGGDEDGDSLVSLSAPQGRREAEDDGNGNGENCPVAPPAGDEEDSGRVVLAEREASLAAREDALLAREAAAAADDRRRAAEAAVAPHVEAGRVLPAERPALIALFAALDGERGGDDAGGDDDRITVSFASASGGEVQMPPAAILERFIEGLPRRIDYRTLAGGPVPGATAPTGSQESAGEDSERIAAEARTLMAAEAERGVTLTPAEAVDRARARRGLGIQGGT